MTFLAGSTGTMINSTYIPQEGTHLCKLLNDSVFDKGETILAMKDMPHLCGLLREGSAHISCIDSEGRETIPEILNMGDCFGNLLIYSAPNVEYFIVADTLCRVTFINIRTVLSGCGRNCSNHPLLLRSLLLLSSKHSQIQSEYIGILSKHTTREKLMTCFRNYRTSLSPDDTFQLPMTFSNLANYLCIDRSAMMRELRKMNDDGLIISKGRTITILEDSHSEPQPDISERISPHPDDILRV